MTSFVAVRPRIGVIHGTRTAIPPLEEAFERGYPEVTVRTILDESLTLDLPEDGEVPARLMDRLYRLMVIANDGSLDALLVACSSYADTVRRFREDERPKIPVIKADEPLYRDVAQQGFHRVGVLVTLPAAVPTAIEGLNRAYHERGLPRPEADVRCVNGDTALADKASRPEWTSLAEESLRLRTAGAEAIALGQYSIATERDAIAERCGLPTFSGASSAVSALRAVLAVEDAASPSKASRDCEGAVSAAEP